MELVLNGFSEIFPLKSTQRKGKEIFSPKQMLQRLAIAITQVKAGYICIFEIIVNKIK